MLRNMINGLFSFLSQTSKFVTLNAVNNLDGNVWIK